MVKNEPSSRRRALFAQHSCHVLLFEMLTERLALVKLKGSNDMSYWTLIDTDGNIQPIPEELNQMLREKNWTQIQAQRSLQNNIFGPQRDSVKQTITIVLSSYKKYSQDMNRLH